MRKRYLLIVVAWLMYVLAWTLPVHKYGAALPKALPGWDALGISFSPLLDHLHGKREMSVALALLLAISGATNILMIGSVWAVTSRGRRVLNALFWTSVAAAIINSNWCVWSSPSELRIGYFLWSFSFLVLAGGIHAALKAEGDEPRDLQSLVSGNDRPQVH